MNPALIALAAQELPKIVAVIKEIFRRQNPDEADPTSEEVIAAFNKAYEDSLAKDADWLAKHPK